MPKTQTTMPTEMSEWVIEQMKAIELGTLDADKTGLFLSFLTEMGDSNPYLLSIFKKFKQGKEFINNI